MAAALLVGAIVSFTVGVVATAVLGVLALFALWIWSLPVVPLTLVRLALVALFGYTTGALLFHVQIWYFPTPYDRLRAIQRRYQRGAPG